MERSVCWRNTFFSIGMMVLLMLFVMACTPGNGPVGTPKAFNEIFVANDSGDNVMVFSRTADGAATPLRTITGLSEPDNVAIDGVNNELFVYNASDLTIKVFSRTADGAATPLRTITGTELVSTGDITGLVVDPVNNELFVSSNDTVFVFSRTADGAATPLRTISGFNDTRGLALDTTNNELFVADLGANTIYVVSRTAAHNHRSNRSRRIGLRSD